MCVRVEGLYIMCAYFQLVENCVVSVVKFYLTLIKQCIHELVLATTATLETASQLDQFHHSVAWSIRPDTAESDLHRSLKSQVRSHNIYFFSLTTYYSTHERRSGVRALARYLRDLSWSLRQPPPAPHRQACISGPQHPRPSTQLERSQS